MKEKNKLDDKIKSSFESLNKKAPDMLWNQLSDSLDTDSPGIPESQPENDRLYHKIRDSFSLLRQKAPQHVWQSINRQLNIDLVWSRLSKELDHSPSAAWYGGRWAAVLLLLIFSFAGAYYVYRQQAPILISDATENMQDIAAPQKVQDSAREAFSVAGEAKGSSIQQQTEKMAIPDQGEQKEAPATNGQEEEFATSSWQLAEERPPSSSTVPSSDISYQKVEKSIQTDSGRKVDDIEIAEQKASTTAAVAFSKGSASEGKPSLGSDTLGEQAKKGSDNSSYIGQSFSASEGPSVTGIPYRIEKLPMNNAETKGNTFFIKPLAIDSLPFMLLAEKDEEQKLTPNKFSVGPVLVYNNSWLLNNETRSSFDKGSLISRSPTFKQNLGVVLYYAFNPKNTLAMEFHFISKAGQEYNTFSDGYYQKMGLELSYYKFYLQYQRNFFSNGPGLFSDITAKAGFYGGLLHRRDGEIRNTESSYSSFDYGVRFALGQEKSLNRLIIGYGISGERGLMNIFTGSGKMPARFNKTYTLNFGPYLNFRYNTQRLIKTR